MKDYMYMSRDDFEAWYGLLGGKPIVKPNYSSSKMVVSGKLPCGTRWELTVTALNGQYFGRGNDWTRVRLSTWVHDNFSLYGEGSRGDEAHDFVHNAFSCVL